MNKIKKTLLRARLDSISFSGHFFRQETINTAIIVGISKEQIKLLDKWKSNIIDKYFFEKISISMSFAANRQLHLTTFDRKYISQPKSSSRGVFSFHLHIESSREIVKQFMWTTRDLRVPKTSRLKFDRKELDFRKCNFLS